MLGVLTLIGEVVAWVLSLGILLSAVIPQPALVVPLSRVTWALFLGAIFTPIVRPIGRYVIVMVWNLRLIKRTAVTIPPSSVEQAKARGILTPLDYCVYMAAFQIIPLKNKEHNFTFYGLTEGEFGASKNHLFREMFGRSPFSMYSDKLNYMIVLKDTLEPVDFDNLRDCWTLCVRDEAARVANVDPEEVTPSIVEQYVSPEMKKLLGFIGETTVLAWSK